MEPKSIVLVDDHVVVRSALSHLIRDFGPYQILREFDTCDDLLAELPEVTKSHLIILDVNLPIQNGFDTLDKLKYAGNKLPILILSSNKSDLEPLIAFRSGARGYLRKNCKVSDLKAAIDDIFKSGYYHNQYFINSIQCVGNDYDNNQNARKIFESFTSKEKNFLKFICHEDEYTYSVIAEKMKVSMRAVDKCRENLFKKFNIKSKAGLVLFVYRHGLLNYL